MSLAESTPNKYRATRTLLDGIWFASKKEAKRYGELKLLQRAGQISKLELQPKFPLIVNGTQVANYIADFAYLESGKQVVEDVKGMKTPIYRLKRKIMAALYGLQIKET